LPKRHLLLLPVIGDKICYWTDQKSNENEIVTEEVFLAGDIIVFLV